MPSTVSCAMYKMMMYFLSFYPKQDSTLPSSILKNLLFCPTPSKGPDGSFHCSSRALINADATTLVNKVSQIAFNHLEFTHPPTHFLRGQRRVGLNVLAPEEQIQICQAFISH